MLNDAKWQLMGKSNLVIKSITQGNMPNNWVHTFLLILPFLHGRRSNDLSPNLCVRLNFQLLHTKMFEEFSRNGLLFSFFDFCNKIGLFFHDC